MNQSTSIDWGIESILIIEFNYISKLIESFGSKVVSEKIKLYIKEIFHELKKYKYINNYVYR